MACEGAHGWRRKYTAIRYSDCTRCTFRAGVPARGACHAHVKSGAPSRAKAGRLLSRFPVPEPDRVWLGPLGPNRAGFGPQRVTFRSSSHPSPGAYKRGNAEPFEPRLSSSEHYLRAIAVQSALLLRGPDPATAVLRDSLPCCRCPAAQPDGPMQSARCHEPRQINKQEITRHITRWERSGRASHGGTCYT